MRKYLRAIARARMEALGVDRINRRPKTPKGAPSKFANSWRRVIFGDLADVARNALVKPGKKVRA